MVRRLLMAASAAIAIASPAAAAKWILTFEGSVYYDIQDTGVFGSGLTVYGPGPRVPVTGRVIVDDTNYDLDYGPGFGHLDAPGGAVAEVKIGNNTFEFDGDWSSIDSSSTGIYISSGHDLNSSYNYDYESWNLQLNAYSLSALFPSNDFRRPGLYDFTSGPVNYHYGSVTKDSYQFDEYLNETHYNDYVQFSVDRLRIAPDVPEPASWTMMIGGFALVGRGMRARRQLPVGA